MINVAEHTKVKAFWDAIPDDATLKDLALGLTITFSSEGKQYSVDTSFSPKLRRMNIADYKTGLSLRALIAKEINCATPSTTNSNLC